MKITWLGQSGYLLEDSGTRVFLDPYLSDIVNKVANRPRLIDPPVQPEEITGSVICTHDHLDHLDPEAIEKMHRDQIDFYAPSSCKAHLEELGCTKIHPLDLGDTVQIGPFAFTGVFADHSVDAIGIFAEWNGHSFYFTGDTLANPKLEEMAAKNPEFLFICINGKLGNMNADEAVQLTKVLKPKVAVPTHYGMLPATRKTRKFIPPGIFLRIHHGTGKSCLPRRDAGCCFITLLQRRCLYYGI